MTACVSYEPFPRSLSDGLEQVSASTPNCFAANKYVQTDVFLITQCGGYYPQSLYDNGVEANCAVLFDLDTDGTKDILELVCNVARDQEVSVVLGPLSKNERAIATQMFVASTNSALEALKIRLEGKYAIVGLKGSVLPLAFQLEGGANQAADPLLLIFKTQSA